MWFNQCQCQGKADYSKDSTVLRTTELVASSDGVDVHLALAVAVLGQVQLHRDRHPRRLARRVVTQLQ